MGGETLDIDVKTVYTERKQYGRRVNQGSGAKECSRLTNA